MKKVLYRRGFTLIELALVAVILVVMGMAVYGTFVNGINIWKKITQESTIEDTSLFFEKISSDLRNSFKLSDIKFRGWNNKVSFPVAVRYSDEEGVKRSIGQVTYSFDKRKKLLNRREASYSEVYRKKLGKKRILAENVNSLDFQYFMYDADKKQYSWVTSWQEREAFGREVEDHLPLIVRVEIAISKEQGEQKFVKTIPIPSACCWPLIDEKK